MLKPGLFYAIGAAITWGIVYTIDQRILKGISPFALLFVNSVLTTILLAPFLLLNRDVFRSLWVSSPRAWFFILASLILAALANLFIFSSIRILGASTASIFEIAYPFCVVGFSYLAFGTTPTWYFLVGASLIFCGATIIIRFS